MMMYEYEKKLMNDGKSTITGCDEVGRGPMAGPVVCAAVILDPEFVIEGLYDSKALSEKKRETLYDLIKKHALAYAVEFVMPEEVDRVNVYQASRLGMERAVQKLAIPADFILVDAMQLKGLETPQLSLIKGDQKSASIAAASILAKVERDRYMVEIASKYPGYGFEKHKGYPTKHHKETLMALGPCAIHRKTYRPVEQMIKQQLALEV